MKTWIKKNILPIIFVVISAFIFMSGVFFLLSEGDKKHSSGAGFSREIYISFSNVSKGDDGSLNYGGIYLLSDNTFVEFEHDTPSTKLDFYDTSYNNAYLEGIYLEWNTGSEILLFDGDGNFKSSYQELVERYGSFWDNSGSGYVYADAIWLYNGITFNFVFDGTDTDEEGYPSSCLQFDYRNNRWDIDPSNVSSVTTPSKYGESFYGWALKGDDRMVIGIGTDTVYPSGLEGFLGGRYVTYELLWIDADGTPLEEWSSYCVVGKVYDVYPVYVDVIVFDHSWPLTNPYEWNGEGQPQDMIINVEKGQMLPDLASVPYEDDENPDFVFDGYWTNYCQYQYDSSGYSGFGKQVYDAEGRALCTYEGESMVLYPRWIANSTVTFDCNGGKTYRNFMTRDSFEEWGGIEYTSKGAYFKFAHTDEWGTFMKYGDTSGPYYDCNAVLKLATNTDYKIRIDFKCLEGNITADILDHEDVHLYLVGEGKDRDKYTTTNWNECYEIPITSEMAYRDVDIRINSTNNDEEFVWFWLEYNDYRENTASLFEIGLFVSQEEKIEVFKENFLYFGSYYTNTEWYALLNPEREGYYFKGWKLVNDKTGTQLDFIEYNGGATTLFDIRDVYNVTYQAVWEEITYELQFYYSYSDATPFATYQLSPSDPLPNDVIFDLEGTADRTAYHNNYAMFFDGFWTYGEVEQFYEGYTFKSVYDVNIQESVLKSKQTVLTPTKSCFGYSQTIKLYPKFVATAGTGDWVRDSNSDGYIDYADWIVLTGKTNYGTGTLNDPWKVYDYSDLSTMASISLKQGKISGNFVQMDDITIPNEYYWYPMTVDSFGYNGNGKKISNLNMPSQMYDGEYIFPYGGFLRLSSYLEYGISIENLTIYSGNIYANDIAGSVCDSAYGIDAVKNCVNYANVHSNSIAGGICAENTDRFTISNCKNYGIVQADYYAGGIIGQITSSVNGNEHIIQDCYNYGNVTTNHVVGCTGGIVGRVYDDRKKVYIGDSINNGLISGLSNVGGIVGYINTNFAKIEECINLGDITATDNNVGGIVGYLSYGEITSCVNLGNVTGKNYVGGIAGFTQSDTTENNSTKIYGCYVSGNVSAIVNDAGGIVGRIDQNGAYKVDIGQSMFNGSVSASSNKGLLVGMVGFVDGGAKSTATITDCLARSTVSTTILVAAGQRTITSTIYETGSGKGYYDGDFSNWSLVKGNPIPNNVMWMGGQGVVFATPPTGYTKQG